MGTDHTQPTMDVDHTKHAVGTITHTQKKITVGADHTEHTLGIDHTQQNMCVDQTEHNHELCTLENTVDIDYTKHNVCIDTGYSVGFVWKEYTSDIDHTEDTLSVE